MPAFRAPLAAIALLPLIGLAPALAEPQRYQLDPDHTAVAFIIGHVGYSKVLGQFTDVEGSFTYDEATQTLSDLRVVVQTESVDTQHQRRDEHVRNEDFLNVSEYPEMVFTADGGSAETDKEGTVEGELTLLGQTRPLVLDVTLNKAAEYPFGHGQYTLGISARGSLMRSEYGMEYGVANGLVGDEVELILETEALQQPGA